MSNPGKSNQRRRSRDDPIASWYDKSVAALSKDQEEVVEIPREKVGLVIGRKGRRLKEIQEQTGVQVFIKDNQAHLRGTSAQRQKARKIIEDILNPVSTENCPYKEKRLCIGTTKFN